MNTSSLKFLLASVVGVCSCFAANTAHSILFTPLFIKITRNIFILHFLNFSDAGARPPQSCIFGQFLNISAVIGMKYFMYLCIEVIMYCTALEVANHYDFVPPFLWDAKCIFII